MITGCYRHVVMALFVGLAGACASWGGDAVVEETLRLVEKHLARSEKKLASLGHLEPRALAPFEGTHGTDFRFFQNQRFSQQGEYMSEAVHVQRIHRSFAALVPRLAELSNPRSDTTDVIIALYRTASDPLLCAFNAIRIIDTAYITHAMTDFRDEVKALEVRRILSEIHLMHCARKFLPGKDDKAPFQEEMPRFVKFGVKAVRSIPGWQGRVIRDTLDILGIKRLTASIFVKQAVEALEDPRTVREIGELHRWLEVTRRRFRQPGHKQETPPNLWEVAQDITGDGERALRLLGIFSTQHRTLIKTIFKGETHKRREAELTFPLMQCSSIFFLIQEICELTKSPDGNFAFPYPAGFVCGNRKFYHFWSEAFVATSLARRGYDGRQIRFATHNLGRAYEGYTLPQNILFSLKLKTPILPAFRGFRQDVAAHVKGSRFGRSLLGLD